MKLIDRIIFGFIAVCLGILATRALMSSSVQAFQTDLLAWKNVVNVNVCQIGGEDVWKSDISQRR